MPESPPLAGPDAPPPGTAVPGPAHDATEPVREAAEPAPDVVEPAPDVAEPVHDATRSGADVVGSTAGGGEPVTGGSGPGGPVEVDRATLRLALTVGGLVLAVLLGFGLGRLNPPPNPTRTGSLPVTGEHSHAPGVGAHAHGGATVTQGGDADAAGLSISSAGYTLAPSTVEFAPGRAGELRFQIRDERRRPVTRFAVVHDKPLHLVVVRRDLTGYQHLHPTMAADGTWSVPLTLAEPGAWRAYADFTAVADDGRQTAVILGADLAAPGGYAPRPLPAPATQTTVDGFTVGYSGTPAVGQSVPLRFRVTGPGGGAAPLEPYLGAYGHLVALREGDLGYLHVHPEPVRDGDAVTFWLTAPGPGRYRMFLDFQVGGVVRTAAFTVAVA